VPNQWTRKAIEFNGFSIFYLEGGNQSQNKPILFLHGWSVSTEPYREYLELLAQKYWVIAPDLPGFGRSPCSYSLTSYQTYANCILQLIERLNLDRFKLIGHSFGGGVALALAAAVPQAIDSLIVISSTGVPVSLSNTIEGRFTELPKQIAQLLPISLLKIARAFGHNFVFRTRHLITGGQIALDEDIRPWLSEIKAPCLILWGERDCFTPIEIGYSLAETISNSQLQIILEGYHEGCITHPETIATITFNFLNSTESVAQIDYESSST
jgi:pimeloyl-ACP methyl ester carboxylesterase